MNLSDLKNNDTAVITKVRGHGAFRKRIIEMGFVKGQKVEVIKNAPLKDPIEYRIMNYQVSLRRSEAKLIEVITEEEARKMEPSIFNGTIEEEVLRKLARNKHKTINVAFVGNPNSGKTSLFNVISGSREHVGNYSGVTVDAKKGTCTYKDYTINIMDLPGTYSMTAFSPEEVYVRKHIMQEMPDIVVNVLAASNLERNLYLTTQLIDMDLRVVASLNMFDELDRSGAQLDYYKLGGMLGIPFVPTVGSKGKGIDKLLETIIRVYEDQEKTVRHIHINYGEEMERAIKNIRSSIIHANGLSNLVSPRFLAIKLLENDKEAWDLIKKYPNHQAIEKIAKKGIERIKRKELDDSENLITDSKYGFIKGALKETFKEGVAEKHKITETIDTFLTHKLFGYPIFIFFMWFMFEATFTLGQYPMDWIDMGVGWLGEIITKNMSAGPLKDLLTEGLIGGVGGVIVFLPNILILYFFITFMEDSGYLARAAFIMDKLMHRIGLHGKSFIPLIMGFGCNVPATMATRTIENPHNRILTMLIIPLMSCSARLPVYILIVGAFFPEHASSVLLLVYGAGIFLAIILARLFKQWFFPVEEMPFVMELPPYRMPTLKNTISGMWGKGEQYLRKIGGIIMIASIIIWFLGYFPRNVEYSRDYQTDLSALDTHYQPLVTQASGDSATMALQGEWDQKILEINQKMHSEHQQRSYIGRIGKTLEPTLAPLGFNWKVGVGLLSGIAAKELVVSTLGVLYNEGDGGTTTSLTKKIQDEKWESGKRKGQKVWTPAMAMALLLFVLIYFPCIAEISTIKNETGSWKWATFTILYTTVLAWVVAFAAFHVTNIFI